MTPKRQRQGSTQSCQKQRENQELNKAETPTEMHFPLTSATLATCMHSQSPVHNKFLVLSKIKQFSSCSITKLLPLVGTCTHQGSTDLKLPLKLRLPLKICYAMNAMQEV